MCKNLFALFTTVFLLTSTACAQTLIDHTFHLHVQDSAEAPVANLTLMLIDRDIGEDNFVRTDAAGNATIVGHYKDTDSNANFLITPIGLGYSVEMNRQAQNVFEEITTRNWFPLTNRTIISAQVVDHQVQINGATCVAVTMTPICVECRDQVSIVGTGVTESVETAAGKSAVFPGIKASTAQNIFVSSADGRVKSIVLTAAQTATNFDLGAVEFPSQDGARLVSIQATNFQSIKRSTPERPFAPAGDALCIASDASRAYAVYVNETASGVAYVADQFGKRPIMMVPGTYYIVPGMTATPTCMKLERLLRSGREADVLAAGVPRMVVPADANVPVDFTYDALAAIEVVEGIVE